MADRILWTGPSREESPASGLMATPTTYYPHVKSLACPAVQSTEDHVAEAVDMTHPTQEEPQQASEEATVPPVTAPTDASLRVRA